MSTSECIEVRWFVTAEAASGLRPPGRGRRRVDAYHLGSLQPASATKRRGDSGRLEHKARIGEPQPISIGGVDGQNERWVKRRLPDDVDLGGPWVKVRKERWTRPGLEICLLSVDDAVWWSVAIDPRPKMIRRHAKTLGRWRDVLRQGTSCSYPEWLLRLGAGHAARAGEGSSPVSA